MPVKEPHLVVAVPPIKNEAVPAEGEDPVEFFKARMAKQLRAEGLVKPAAAVDVDTSHIRSPYGLNPAAAEAQSQALQEELAAISSIPDASGSPAAGNIDVLINQTNPNQSSPDVVDANAQALDKGGKRTRRRGKETKKPVSSAVPVQPVIQATPVSRPYEALRRIQKENGLGEMIPQEILDTQKAPTVEGSVPKKEAALKTPPMELELAQEEIASEVPETALEKLQKEVDKLRQEYAESDVKNTKAFEPLMRFFRTLSGGDDADTAFLKSEYHSKLTELKNVELEKIKQSGLSGKALKEAMAALLTTYKFEEPERLYAARIQERLAHQKWPGKILGSLEWLGKQYSKRSFATKMIASGACLAAAAVTGGAAPMIARRVVTGAGAAVGIDALLEKRASLKTRSRAEKEKDEQLYVMTVGREDEDFSIEADLQDLERFLDKDIASLNKKLQKRKLGAVFRKTAALGIGFGAGYAAAPVLEAIDNTDVVGTIKEKIAALMNAPEASASLAPEKDVMAEMPPAEPYNPPTDAAQMAAFGEVAGDQGSVSAKMLEEYKVTAADGKKGLWGILDARLPENLTGEDRNRAIANLQRIMQDKLDGMSPAEDKAAGFPTGNISEIHKGTTLHLDKVLSPSDIEKALSGEKMPSVRAAVLDTPIRETVTPISPAPSLDQILESQLPENPPTEAENMKAVRESLVTKYDDARDPKMYLREHPEQVRWFNTKLGTLRMELFLTNEVQSLTESGPSVNPFMDPKLGNTPVSDVLKGKSPLHYSQKLQFERFQAACEKAFGEGGAQIRAGATVNQHTAEMLTKAALEGIKIKGFFKP